LAPEKEKQVAHGRWGEGVGEEPNHTAAKAWSSINHSILSGLTNEHVESVYSMCENWSESGMYSTGKSVYIPIIPLSVERLLL
jgi:hypothetical protein